MSEHLCTNCGHQFQHQSVGARLVFAATGAALGKSQPLVAIVGGILGIVLGSAIDHFIEERIDPTCPECGFVIRALAKTL